MKHHGRRTARGNPVLGLPVLGLPGMGLPGLGLVLLAVALVGRTSEARPPRYLGAHPVAAAVGGGWCRLAVLHVHSYGPDHGALYAQTPEGLVFAGDPTPFGYQGPRHVFFGHHPIPAYPEVFCYLDGPHFHGFEVTGPDWTLVDGVAWYVGTLGGVYQRERVTRARAWDLVYRQLAAERPRVSAVPPAQWRGEPWTAPDAGAAK